MREGLGFRRTGQPFAQEKQPHVETQYPHGEGGRERFAENGEGLFALSAFGQGRAGVTAGRNLKREKRVRFCGAFFLRSL
jgi:hypothetical protein